MADFILAFAGLIFIVGLLPTVWAALRSDHTDVPLTSSLSIAAALVLVCWALSTLGQWLGFWTTLVQAILWLLLAATRRYGMNPAADFSRYKNVSMSVTDRHTVCIGDSHWGKVDRGNGLRTCFCGAYGESVAR